MKTGSGMKIKDKEIEKILKRAQQQKWLNLMMALIDIEDTNKEEIHKFDYNNDIIIVETKKEGLLRYFIGDKDVEDKDKNKHTNIKGDKLGS